MLRLRERLQEVARLPGARPGLEAAQLPGVRRALAAQLPGGQRAVAPQLAAPGRVAWRQEVLQVEALERPVPGHSEPAKQSRTRCLDSKQASGSEDERSSC